MAEDFLVHYGTKRHSGRYPWGSGEDPYQHGSDFLSAVTDLRRQGLTEKEIAQGFGMSIRELRAKKSLAKDAVRAARATEALRLKDKGYSITAIGERMDIPESTVRSLLDPAVKDRTSITSSTANMLKDVVGDNQLIDVGVGVERYLGVSRTRLLTAVEMLKEQGYSVNYVKVPQIGTGESTSIMVLAPPGMDYKTVYSNRDQIKLPIGHYTEDGGRTWTGLEKPRDISSKDVQIRYKEDGGIDKDGVIELRRGVPELSLGEARYAQVRISVDGTHYLKGMAMYSDDMPDGVNVIFNTNKKRGTPKEDVFKPLKDDPENPFGAVVRQRHYIDKNGKKQLSALNIVNEEGVWSGWSKTIASQMLSKQSPKLAKKQLNLAWDLKKDEFDEIMSLTNPVVKKRLLDSFADDCDASSVHLKAAALPRQAAHVILPFPDMKENEIYAPNYKNGEKVVLIRYPHGGTFEIPQLTVNNKNAKANRLIPQAKDAVGIHPKVAERLSGADFDGDTVLVIPNNKGEIRTSSPLKGLKDFDPKTSYPAYEGMKRMTAREKGIQMGKVSNLITDMTIKGATQDEICRAVRHSMVVIDAEKHNLNYKQSAIDNGISSLQKKYQDRSTGGASTLISRATSEAHVPARKERIDPATGKKIYIPTGETYVNRKGKTVIRTVKSKKMAETDDAFSLSSGTRMESIYASYANKLKGLANSARKESLRAGSIKYSPSAKKAYSKEVESLDHKLNIALKNAPRERQAQLLANKVVSAKLKDNPDMDKDDLKKIKGQALQEARYRMGANKQRIDISDKEWEAIQAGAISSNKLSQILNNTDLDRVKQLATPRTNKGVSSAKLARAKSMMASGYSQADVADALGISVSTLSKALNE